ncbi:TonB-dependent receptor plug domain-containing protein [Kaistella anthropi]|nr:TonB-dependent receptor plug domain-containing protein [Kaistella anthropi]
MEVQRGTVGTDLNAIPSFAIQKIEVLRDGAAAQYGSDAIAGAINLALKNDTGKLGGISYGGNLTPTANDHTGDFDGQTIQVDLNYGNKIGKKEVFIT